MSQEGLTNGALADHLPCHERLRCRASAIKLLQAQEKRHPVYVQANSSAESLLRTVLGRSSKWWCRSLEVSESDLWPLSQIVGMEAPERYDVNPGMRRYV